MSDNTDWLAALAVGDAVRIKFGVPYDDPGFCQPSPPGGYHAGQEPVIRLANVARITKRQIITEAGTRFRRSDGGEVGRGWDDGDVSIGPLLWEPTTRDKWETQVTPQHGSPR